MGHYLYKEMILYLYGELKYIQGTVACPTPLKLWTTSCSAPKILQTTSSTECVRFSQYRLIPLHVLAFASSANDGIQF